MVKNKVTYNTLTLVVVFAMLTLTTLLIMNPVFADGIQTVAENLVYKVLFGQVGKSIGIFGIGISVFTFVIGKFTQNPNSENQALIMIAVSAALVKGETLGRAIGFGTLFK